MQMEIRIDVKTPAGQAEKSVKSQKLALLGLGMSKKVKHQQVVANNHFYWILDIDENDYPKLVKKCAAGEVMIKTFYRKLFKTINRVNKISAKIGKGGKWLKKQLIKRLTKLTEHSPDNNSDFIGQFENMDDEEFEHFIEINDKAMMDELLAGELITMEKLKNEKE